jgi:hypothetical protein
LDGAARAKVLEESRFAKATFESLKARRDPHLRLV